MEIEIGVRMNYSEILDNLNLIRCAINQLEERFELQMSTEDDVIMLHYFTYLLDSILDLQRFINSYYDFKQYDNLPFDINALIKEWTELYMQQTPKMIFDYFQGLKPKDE